VARDGLRHRRGVELARRINKDEQQLFHGFIGSDTVGSPDMYISRMLRHANKYPSPTYYSVHKKVGKAADNTLRALKELRYGGLAMLTAVVVIPTCYLYQSFYQNGSTGDAAENQSYFDTVITIASYTFLACLGYAVYSGMGSDGYRDPRRFRDYFRQLLEELGGTNAAQHPHFKHWFAPESEKEVQHSHKFHFELYQGLLRLDLRASAYTLAAWGREHHYWYRPRSVTVAVDEPDVVAHAEDRRRMVSQGVLCIRLGICTAGEYDVAELDAKRRYRELANERIREISERAAEILEEPHEQQDAIAGLRNRITTFRGSIMRHIDENIHPDHVEDLRDTLNPLIDVLLGRLEEAINEEVDWKTVNIKHMLGMIERIFQARIDQHFRDLTAEEQPAVDPAIVAQYPVLLRDIRPVIKLAAKERVQAAMNRWSGTFSAYLKSVFTVDGMDSLERQRGGLSAEDMGHGLGRGASIRRRQGDIISERMDADRENRRRLGALNQAIGDVCADVPEADRLVLDPITLQFFDAFMQTVDEEDDGYKRPIFDPLFLNLLDGYSNKRCTYRHDIGAATYEADPESEASSRRSSQNVSPVSMGGTESIHSDAPQEDKYDLKINHGLFTRDGYLNPHIEGDDLTEGQCKALQHQRREAARRGWLYHDAEIDVNTLPQEAQDLRGEHRDWILPPNDTPSYYDDINLGSEPIYLAQETYDVIHGGGSDKTDKQRATELAEFLGRLVGHVNPLDCHRADRNLEAQMCDRAHILAHLLHRRGDYKCWEHWVSPEKVTTEAFKLLTTEQQVWLIFELMSGPPYAKLVALSILHDPEFIGAADYNILQRKRWQSDSPFNAFMRKYVRFMRQYTSDPTIDAEVRSQREMLFAEQLTLIMDSSVGADLDPDTGMPLPGGAGYVEQYIRKHAAKSGVIFQSLLHRLKDDERDDRYVQVEPYIRAYLELDAAAEYNPTDEELLVQLILLEAYFQEQLGCSSSAHEGVETLYAGCDRADRGALGNRIIDRDRLQDVRWLIARIRARSCATKMFAYMPAGQEASDAVGLLLIENLDFIRLGGIQAIQPGMPDVLRAQIWQALARLTREPGGHIVVGNFIKQNYASLIVPAQIAGLHDILQLPEITAVDRRLLVQQIVLAAYQLDGAHARELGEMIYAVYHEISQEGDRSILEFYQYILMGCDRILPGLLFQYVQSLEALVKYQQTQADQNAAEADVLHQLSYQGDADIFAACFPLIDGNVTDLNKAISITILETWLDSDIARCDVGGDPQHVGVFRVHERAIQILNTAYSPSHDKLLAMVLKSNLRDIRGPYARQKRGNLYHALERYAGQCSALDNRAENHIHDEGDPNSFKIARALFRMRKRGLISLKQEQEIVNALISEHPEIIWVYVNEGFRLTGSTDPAGNTTELARFDIIADRVLELLSREQAGRTGLAPVMPIMDKFIQAMADDHSSVMGTNHENSLGVFMATMLNRYQQLGDNPSIYQTAAMLHLYRAYLDRMLAVLPQGMPAADVMPVWMSDLFANYLKAYYTSRGRPEYADRIFRRTQEVEAALADLDFEDERREQWHRFRTAIVTGHPYWHERYRHPGEQDCHIVNPMLSLLEKGFNAGDGRYDGVRRTMVVDDALLLVTGLLKLEPNGYLYNYADVPDHLQQASRHAERISYPHVSQIPWRNLTDAMESVLHYRERVVDDGSGERDSPQRHATAAALTDDNRTWLHTMARFIHVFLRQPRLDEGQFQYFSIEIMPQLIRGMRNRGYAIENDHQLLTALWDTLSAEDRDVVVDDGGDVELHDQRQTMNRTVQRRMVLAYCYWKYNNSDHHSTSARAANFLCRQGQYEIIDARQVQSIMRVFGEDEFDDRADFATDGRAGVKFNTPFFNNLGITNSFRRWLQGRLGVEEAIPQVGIGAAVNADEDDVEVPDAPTGLCGGLWQRLFSRERDEAHQPLLPGMLDQEDIEAQRPVREEPRSFLGRCLGW
jgi:hypothetical protein